MLLAAIIFSLVLSALFSGAEIAFVTANKLRIELKKKKGATRGNIIAGFYERPALFLGTMLVGNNIALVIFSTLTREPLDNFFSQTFGISSAFLLLLMNVILLTVIVLIVGEFLPKTLFRLYANNVLFLLAYPLRILQFLLGLPAKLMTQSSNVLLKWVFKAAPEEVETVFTRLDLENFINDSTTHSEEEIDKELFGKALNLKEVRIRDCMVPRTEIENIDVSATVEDLIKLFEETKLSRIIITNGDINNVLGYVHHQQLLKQPKNISSLVMNIPFVPEVMYVTNLMNVFIKSHINIACVVDEFGGVSGIITLEDILEEIFGEIEDEYDQEEYVETEVSDTEYILSGRLEIAYLNEKYPSLSFPEGDYQTLSGYLVMTTETIPEQGAEIEMDGYKFVLELVSNTKIETIRVIKLPQES